MDHRMRWMSWVTTIFMSRAVSCMMMGFILNNFTYCFSPSCSGSDTEICHTKMCSFNPGSVLNNHVSPIYNRL